MRVLHAESSHHWGGQEFRALEQMTWLAQRGHETFLAARPGSEISRRAIARGLPVFLVPFGGQLDPRAISTVRRLVRKLAIDLVDCHGSRDAAVFAFAKPLTTIIRSRHIIQPLKGKLHRRIQWRMGCEGVIATAHCIKEMLVGNGLVAAERATVVGEWADETFFDISARDRHRAEVRREFGLASNRPLLTTLAMLRDDKAQEVLIEAAAELRRRGRDATCLIVGEAPRGQESYEAMLRHLVHSHNLDDRVIFTGYRQDAARLTQASDVLVVPSILEAQSRVVPQAFASRIPVVASRVGGLPELVVPGQTGWLVEPRDAVGIAEAVVNILDHPERAVRISEQARRLAEAELRMEKKMEQTLHFYDQTMRRRKLRRAR